MRQWEIYLYPYREAQPHPVVILSSDERCVNDAITHVNGLLCTSVRLNRDLKPHEAGLDEADGLDCACGPLLDSTGRTGTQGHLRREL